MDAGSRLSADGLSRHTPEGSYAQGSYGQSKSAQTSFATRAGTHFLLGTKSQGALATSFQDGLAAPDQANAGKAAQAPPSRAKLRQPCPPKAGRAPPRWEAGPDQAARGQERGSPSGLCFQNKIGRLCFENKIGRLSFENKVGRFCS